MWEVLPILRTYTDDDSSIPYSFLSRDHVYDRYDDVEVMKWKHVPENIKEWSLSLWRDHFKIKRNPVSKNDLLIWIPRKGTLVAKYGRWIGDSRSKQMVYVCYNYVDKEFRGEGIAKKMILSMAYEITKRWGPISFMFELKDVPASLRTAVPLLQFTYMWVPFVSIRVPPKWSAVSIDLTGQKGFHCLDWTGYKAFEYDGCRIVFDPHDDIVYYDDYSSLHSFDALPIPGAYCRFFSPAGNIHVYVENMFFTPSAYNFEHYLIV
jgi:hypothetical protein